MGNSPGNVRVSRGPCTAYRVTGLPQVPTSLRVGLRSGLPRADLCGRSVKAQRPRSRGRAEGGRLWFIRCATPPQKRAQYPVLYKNILFKRQFKNKNSVQHQEFLFMCASGNETGLRKRGRVLPGRTASCSGHGSLGAGGGLRTPVDAAAAFRHGLLGTEDGQFVFAGADVCRQCCNCHGTSYRPCVKSEAVGHVVGHVAAKQSHCNPCPAVHKCGMQNGRPAPSQHFRRASPQTIPSRRGVTACASGTRALRLSEVTHLPHPSVS